MKRILSTIFTVCLSLSMMAQGWPANYGGVMLQGFSWDSYDDSQWTRLESQAPEIAKYFDLIWVPQSGKCLEEHRVMGYTPYYYFNQNSSFGTEAELKSMISTYKKLGTGIIADIVINHHNTTGWFGFPAETYNGVTYQFQTTDITANDDGGATAAGAKSEGVSLSANNDEGEDWSGMRDLDHKSSNVQAIIKAYEKFLLEDMGYTGFRYDMVKGFAGSHVGDYNKAAGVEYSVGEYWDGTKKIKSWIDATEKESAAFDFQFRYDVRDAINGNKWSKLCTIDRLIDETGYKRYAITFVENHDMQDRGTTNGYSPDPIRRDTLAANAYLLSMPGTPCVFFPHWKAYKQDIKGMIDVRKAVGINNESTWADRYTAAPQYKTTKVRGTKGTLLSVVGAQSMVTYLDDTIHYVKVVDEPRYAYWFSTDMNTTWADKASGQYNKDFDVLVSAVTDNADAKLVYTLDGTVPTSSSQQIESGSKIHINHSCILTLGLLIGNNVSGVESREYERINSTPVKIYVNADQVPTWDTSSGINFWSWGGDGTHTPNNISWPGDKVTTTATINGKNWFVKDFTLNSDDDEISFVFSTGSGSPQSHDVTNVNKTSFFEITNTTDDMGYYLVSDVTETNSIENAVNETSTKDNAWYTVSGMRLKKAPTQKGIYIHQGKKIVIR